MSYWGFASNRGRDKGWIYVGYRGDLLKSGLRGYGTLKYGDVHEKFNFLEIQDLRPLRTCQKHFETILPNFLPDECEI